MPPKFSLEKYKNLADEIGGKYVLDTIPKFTSIAVEGWKCSKCNIIFKRSYGNLRFKGACMCTDCSRKKPYLKVEDFQKVAKSFGGEFLLDHVPGNHDYICKNAWKCEKGHIFDKSYRNVVDGLWCKICSGFKKGLEAYQELASKNQGTFTGNVPKSIMDKTEGWVCKRGHKLGHSYHYVQHGYWCVECDKIEKKEKKGPPCKYVGRTGSSKGEPCGSESYEEYNGYCRRHFKYLEKMEKKKETKEAKKTVETKEETKDILDLVLPFDQKEVRVLGTSIQPWFVAKDVAEILGYKRSRDAIDKHVRGKNKTTIGNFQEPRFAALNLHPDTVIINEAGLYSLILRSKLPSAEKFEDWVTSEVLPSIRKSGIYEAPPDMKAQFDTLNVKLEAAEQLLLEAEQEIDEKDEEIFKVERKVERMKARRQNVQFKTKNAIYLVQNMKETPPDIKFGQTDNFNKRMRIYRTNAPYTKILYLVFVEENDLVERSIKAFYKNDMIVPENHEFIIKLPPMAIINKIEEIMKFFNLPHNIDLDTVEYYNKGIEDDYENEVAPRLVN